MASTPEDDSDVGKRSRIVEAALDTCERRGVEGARMEEVASLARVSKGTLYRFFDSKHDLFLATIIDSYEESLRIIDTSVDAAVEPRQRLDGMFDGLTRVLSALAPRMSVYYQAWGVVAGAPEFQERLYGFLRRFHAERGEEITDAVRDGQRAGVFQPDADAAAFAEGVMALLSGFLYRAAFDPERATAEGLRATFDALLRGLAPAAVAPAEPKGAVRA
jgi:AcrR family transcriptional regulator